MSTPIIISGTTGEAHQRRFCQFWGPYKIAGRERDECLASMGTADGLAIDPQCPRSWLPDIWAAYALILAGEIPEATHTVLWTFNRPAFTPITKPADVLFDLGSLS